ncbi:MAG TPA: AAA family ATPase [Saprospiraceae bacterium]|nr:AAA family ATPase [Saprospiraceae bacterium]
MMDAQTQRLRNNFILLKNGGKDFDSIIKEMEGVSIKNLKAWDKSYIEEMEKITNHYNSSGLKKFKLSSKDKEVTLVPNTPKHNVITSFISNVDKNGEYIKNTQVKFNLSFKDGIIFKLWQVSTSDLDKLKDDSQIEYLKELVNKSKWAHDILKNQLLDIKIDKFEIKDGFEYKPIFSIKDINLSEDVNNAIYFYLENFYHPEVMANKGKKEVNISLYHYNLAIDILPIALKQIEIIDYQGIKKLLLGGINVDSQWIFITGENGFGKTSFLQALTIGLFGIKDQNNDLLYNSKNANIIVEYKNGNESFINQTISDEIISLKNLVCYGPTRLNIQSGFTKEDEVKALSVTQSLFSAQSTLLNIENRLIIWKLSNDKKFDYVVKIFKKLIPYLAEVTLSTDNTKIIYTEKEPSTSKKYGQVDFLQLASGFRSLIGMIGDMILRFHLNQPEIENPSDFTGIVIIDEFDLHLHPKLQMELPSKLSEIFPLVQFIVSTHSAIPLLGAPKNSTIIKVSRNKADGITAEILDIDLSKLTPNIILTSPIFDMDTITSKSNKSIQDVRTEDDYESMQKSDNIDKLLEEKEKEGKKYPDSLFV